jgi:hypothetical protein
MNGILTNQYPYKTGLLKESSNETTMTVNARMVLINSFRRNLELVLSTKDAVSLVNIDVRLALFRAFGLRNGLGLAEVGDEFRS